MAENNTDTIDVDKFLNLLLPSLPDNLHGLIRDNRDEFHKIFCNLSFRKRRACIDILSTRASEFRKHLLILELLGYPVASVPQLFNDLFEYKKTAHMEDKRISDSAACMPRHFSGTFDLAEYYAGNTGFQHQRSEPSNGTPLQLWQKMSLGSPDMRICFFDPHVKWYGNPNYGAGSSGFQHQRLEPSNDLAISVDWSLRVPKLPRVMFLDEEPTLLMTKSILPLEEDLHSNAAGTRYLSNQQKDVAISVAELLGGPEPSRARNPNNGAAGILFQYQRSEPSAGTPLHYIAARHSADVAISAAGHGTPPYHHTTGFHTNTAGTDLAISVAGSPSVPKPSHATVLDYVTNLMKEISVSLNGNPQLARDHPKWFTTLLGINGGVIITLISKSTSNNPQSLSTEIMESFTALSAVVGFSASLAGLYLITNKPQTLPVSCDSEVATPKMGIVGGIATAFAFMAGVLLLLPNNPFRWITLGLASAAFLIPVLIKLLR
ncbi:uncharacterized protein LOC111307691 isoform X1 [Durio zibethinus]|uniref:Uncharacterized protein LOC111307691 isoform X1 n=1 Tax=Durio zibethinus TaxID=66656 RepID=A0A6P6A9J6_DURZI|nr:uncharacterized protein LOC111307691 isoform X1 [Durio zibethinus]